MAAVRAFLAVLLFPALSLAQEPDSQLMAAINAVQAVDNHAHVVAPDIEHDTDFDALRCDTLPSTTTLARYANTRFGPDLQAAWKALYGLDRGFHVARESRPMAGGAEGRARSARRGLLRLGRAAGGLRRRLRQPRDDGARTGDEALPVGALR